MCSLCLFFFFFNDTATTEIYTLSLHDALPILLRRGGLVPGGHGAPFRRNPARSGHHVHDDQRPGGDRKSTRLNSSHVRISYAVFCLKKKKKKDRIWSLDCIRYVSSCDISSQLC